MRKPTRELQVPRRRSQKQDKNYRDEYENNKSRDKCNGEEEETKRNIQKPEEGAGDLSPQALNRGMGVQTFICRALEFIDKEILPDFSVQFSVNYFFKMKLKVSVIM